MTTITPGRGLLALVALASTSCFAVTDLGRFEEAPSTSATTPTGPNLSSLNVAVTAMVSHVAERVEFRVVDGSNVIQARAIIFPLGGPDASFAMANGVPRQNGPFRLDFFADHDSSGAYDPRPDTFNDHAWRIPLDPKVLDAASNTYKVQFEHNTSFTNLNTPTPALEYGRPFLYHLRAMGPFLEKRIEIRVADKSTKRQVAMYRIPVLKVAEADLTVSGMIESDVGYSVEVYSDDGAPSAANPRAFRAERGGTDSGLEDTFSGSDPTASGMAAVTDFAKP